MRGDFGLGKFEASKDGQRIAAIIEKNIIEIEVLAKHGIPPVKAVDADVAAAFGDRLTNAERQFVGRMIFKRLGQDVWKVKSRKEVNGRVFSKGSTFELA